MIVFYFLFGAILGSFAAALTYRWPREESIVNGRSKCPNCKKLIHAYDNIPILSYLVLKGKCRSCKKQISRRYLYIEIIMATLFALFFYFSLATPLNLFLIFITFSIFIVDFEHQYIPDTFTFVGLGFVVLHMFLLNINPFVFLASGLSAGVFLLAINLVTFGKGMGLGDVKLALFLGTALGYPNTITWMFLSFILGSIIGLILIIFKQKKLKQRVAFGPFLVTAFYLILLFGLEITAIIFPTIWF